MQLVWAIAHKFHLITPTKDTSDIADSADRNRDITRIAKALESLTEEVRTLHARIEERPRHEKESPTMPPTTQPKANAVFATGPTYKPTRAAQSQLPKPTKPQTPYHTNQPKNPMQSHHPSRLVVIARGEELDQQKLNPRALVTYINDALASGEDSRHLRVASAQYNHRRNLILMTREDQTGADLLKHAERFIHVFEVPVHTLELVTDDRCFKVRIDGVWTGKTGTVHTPEELLEELGQVNPIMSNVKLISQPKWIRSAEDLKMQDFSSIVLEFGTEDDAIKILEHQLCAEHHDESTHAGEDNEMDTTDSTKPNKCANCGGAHPATDRKCPERIWQAGIAREKEMRKEAVGGGRRRGREERAGREETQRADDGDDGFTVATTKNRKRHRPLTRAESGDKDANATRPQGGSTPDPEKTTDESAMPQ
ncbi:hypothetical protein H0H92_004135 [Tricholoma furcatifolium]|nr:hypothetical protein H0H92_004135 [Tricholoma furcatifolium]